MTLVYRAMHVMAWAGALLIPAAAWSVGGRMAVGLASGMLWALANAWALSQLVHVSLNGRRISWQTRVLWWIVKIPGLYALGASALLCPWSSPVGFLIGFSLWFVALIVGALQDAVT